jgi:hypothetical protein
MLSCSPPSLFLPRLSLPPVHLTHTHRIRPPVVSRRLVPQSESLRRRERECEAAAHEQRQRAIDELNRVRAREAELAVCVGVDLGSVGSGSGVYLGPVGSGVSGSGVWAMSVSEGLVRVCSECVSVLLFWFRF